MKLSISRELKMKKIIATAALLAPLAAYSQAISFSSMHSLCHAEGHKMATFGKCLREKLDSSYPSWQQGDEDSQQVVFYLDFLDTIGKRVKKKEIKEAEANEMARKELLNLVMQKQAKLAKEKQEKEEQKRQAAERAALVQKSYNEYLQQKAERDRYDQVQQALRLQEEQNRIDRNTQLINTGLQLMQLGQRQYAPPPTIVYPQETTINIQQPNNYRFWDSRPYK